MRLLGLALRENGVVWTALLGVYLATSRMADAAFRRADRRRARLGLPGLNSRRLNREIWSRWDWGRRGEEWTYGAGWKQGIVKRALEPLVAPGARVLEIGPGAGRWTEMLLGRAGSVVAVDLSATAVEACRARFGERADLELVVNDGASLSCLADRSVDAVWSFDVFVHLNAVDVERYLDELRRVLRPGGRAAIHHGTRAGATGGWRSDLTGERIDRALRERGFLLTGRLAGWSDATGSHAVGYPGDVISLFELAAEGEAKGALAGA